MSIDTIIAHRTQKKEIRLSGDLVMTREEWEKRGGIYHGTISQARKEGYCTVRCCELLGEPVTDEELKECKDFAMYKGVYAEYMICIDTGKKVCPCLPVFYREQAIQSD